MNIYDNKWTARWFHWSCRVLDNTFNTDKRQTQYSNGTNLCHYFQTLFWAGLVTLWSVVVYLSAAVAVVTIPILLVDSVNTLLVVVSIIVGVIAIIAVFCIIFLLLENGPKIFNKALSATKTTILGSESKPSFFGMIVHYFASIRKRFCPTIRFTKDDTNE